MMADLARLAGGNFLVMGRAGMDLYADPPGTRIEEAARFIAELGGSSANIAVALTRAGCSAVLLTCVSDDAVGRFCRAQLLAYGVNCDHLRPAPGEARNSLAVVETRLHDCQSVIYRNNAADFAMSRADVERVDYAAYSALIATGTVLAAQPSRDAAFRAFDLARAAGLPLIFDLDYRPYSWPSAAEASATYARAARVCDVVVGNEVEFAFLAGSDGGGHDDGLAAARRLRARGAQIVVYKMGAAGSHTFTPAGDFSSGTFSATALKPTGAGDAFLGNMIAALAGGHSLRAAVQRGSAAAAMVVARVGCAPAMPSPPDLDAFMAAAGPATP